MPIRSIRRVTVVGTGAAQRVMGPNSKRVGLLLCPATNNVGCVWLGEPPASANDGITIQLAGGALMLTEKDIGPVVKAGVFAFITAASIWNVIEIMDSGETIEDINGS